MLIRKKNPKIVENLLANSCLPSYPPLLGERHIPETL